MHVDWGAGPPCFKVAKGTDLESPSRLPRSSPLLAQLSVHLPPVPASSRGGALVPLGEDWCPLINLTTSAVELVRSWDSGTLGGKIQSPEALAWSQQPVAETLPCIVGGTS